MKYEGDLVKWIPMNDKRGKLLLSIFYGFMGMVVSLFILTALLEWTLSINIQEFDGFGLLGLIIWGFWIAGGYLYFTRQEELHIQNEVERLRSSEGKYDVSWNAFTDVALIRLNHERETKERSNAEQQVGRALADTEWRKIKSFRVKQKETLEKDQKGSTSHNVSDSFKRLTERRAENEREYTEFLKKF
jgi:hypothetical protein